MKKKEEHKKEMKKEMPKAMSKDGKKACCGKMDMKSKKK